MNIEPEGVDREVRNEDAGARREFLRKIGKFAAVTPPLMATMLTVMSQPALASGSGAGGGNSDGWSKGRGGGNAWGKGGAAKNHGKGHGRGHKGETCASDQAAIKLSGSKQGQCG